MISVKRLAVVSLMALLPALTSAEVIVSHYEPIQATQLNLTDKTAQSFGPALGSADEKSLRFEALGQSFDLRLQNNDRVAAGIDANMSIAGLRAYRGHLAGKPESWARIVVFEGIPRGLIWDGAQMIAIEAPNDSLIDTDTAIAYRLADVHITPGTMSCESASLSGSAASIVKTLATSQKTALARGPGAVSEITVSTIGDFEFTNARGGDAAAAAALMTRMNNVDGYFSEQVGVQITVPNPVETHSDPNDPFTGTLDSDELLDELSEYRLQNSTHSNQGLTHLWTGKDLEGTTVGVAWRGTLCEPYFGAGLSEGNESAFLDSLIAAHEIGHNFNAQHDGEAGTSCENETGMFIMSASVNGSDTFSDCSIGVMQAEAAAAACVVPLPTIDVGIRPTNSNGRLFVGLESTIEYEISSNGLTNAPGVTADFALPAFLDFNSAVSTLGSCVNGAGTVDCDLGEVVGLSVQQVSLTVTPTSTGAGTLLANVATTDPDERSGNDQHQLQITVEEPVDLVANAPSAASVLVNATTTVRATVRNDADADASQASLRVDLQQGLRADSADWSIGTCSVSSQRVDCTANVFAAQSSAELSVTVTAISSGRRNVTLTLDASQADTNPGDNTAVGEVVVTNPNNNNDDDESGGSLNLFLLLVLAGAIALRGRRRQLLQEVSPA